MYFTCGYYGHSRVAEALPFFVFFIDTSLKEYLSSHPSRGLHSSVRRPHRRTRHRRQASLSKPPQPPPLQEEENEDQQPLKRQRRGSSSSKLSLKLPDQQLHTTEDGEIFLTFS